MAFMPSETTTIKGVWWKPEKPEEKINGEITYGAVSGAEVDLYAYFGDPFKQNVERFTLHGVTFQGKPITLFRCSTRSGSIHLGAFRQGSCKVSSYSGIVGGHFESLDKVCFKRLFAKFTGLREWALISGFKMSLSDTLETYSLAYKIPDPIFFGEFDAITVRLEFNSSLKPAMNHFECDQECTLVLEARQMEPYPKFEKIIRAFNLFLSLPLQRPVYCARITGNVQEPKEIVQGRPIFEDYFLIRKAAMNKWKEDELTPYDQLFTLPELAPSPEFIFTRFLKKKERLQASMDLYFSTIYNSDQTPRVEFLTLAQGLEAYHRAVMPGKYLDDESFQNSIRRKLWDAVPVPPEIDADFRASLNKKFNYLHEFSLNRRLKDLARKHEAVLKSLLGEPDAFSQRVSDLRNRLTHPSDTDPNPDGDYLKLLRLSEQMSLLLEVCFLDEIGFATDRIKTIISERSHRARRIQGGWI